jgi:hypothetical protein
MSAWREGKLGNYRVVFEEIDSGFVSYEIADYLDVRLLICPR